MPAVYQIYIPDKKNTEHLAKLGKARAVYTHNGNIGALTERVVMVNPKIVTPIVNILMIYTSSKRVIKGKASRQLLTFRGI